MHALASCLQNCSWYQTLILVYSTLDHDTCLIACGEGWIPHFAFSVWGEVRRRDPMIIQVSRRNWVEWHWGGRRFGQAGEGKSIDQVMESELDAEQGEEGDDIRSFSNRGLQELTRTRSRFILLFFHLAWIRMIWPKNRHPNYVATRQVTAGAVEEEEEEEKRKKKLCRQSFHIFLEIWTLTRTAIFLLCWREDELQGMAFCRDHPVPWRCRREAIYGLDIMVRSPSQIDPEGNILRAGSLGIFGAVAYW